MEILPCITAQYTKRVTNHEQSICNYCTTYMNIKQTIDYVDYL